MFEMTKNDILLNALKTGMLEDREFIAYNLMFTEMECFGLLKETDKALDQDNSSVWFVIYLMMKNLN